MAYAYNSNSQLLQNQNNPQQNYNNAQMFQQQQNIQPLFPQPQGNVYNINSTLEVANVPVGAGISVALCLNEGVMYIKSMQNGNPLFWVYKIEPYNDSPKNEAAAQEEATSQYPNYDERFLKIEKQIDEIQTNLKNQKGGEFQL